MVGPGMSVGSAGTSATNCNAVYPISSVWAVCRFLGESLTWPQIIGGGRAGDGGRGCVAKVGARTLVSACGGLLTT